MREETISQIGKVPCYVNSRGDIFLVSDQDFEHFKNLNQALKTVKEEMVSLFIEKEKFFKSLSIPKDNDVLKKIRIFRISIEKDTDPHYFLEDKKEDFFEILKKIEEVKVFSAAEKDPIILKIIKIRDQLLNRFIQATKLIEIKKENESTSRKISKELTSCREELKMISPQEEIDQFSKARLDDRLFYCKIHLRDAVFIKPYRKRFQEIEDFLFDLNFKEVTDFTTSALQEKIKELCEIFEYKVALR
ncbi:MAG: hypothetical protein ACQEP3_02530 [Patescibacteria group bacterium]